MRPAATALLDQAQAAIMQSVGAMLSHAAHHGGTLEFRTAGPVATRIVERFRQRVLSGRVDTCPHITPTAPQPAFWMPWAPGRIRCAQCAIRAAERIRNSPENYRCDRCKRVSTAITTVALQLPAVLVDLDPLPPVSTPPVQLHIGLCHACHKAERQTDQHDGKQAS